MNPPDNSHVKILLTNSTLVEGIVEEWFGNAVKLRSLQDNSYLIINNPQENIMLTKVFLGEPTEETAEETADESSYTPPLMYEDPQTELDQEFEQVYNQPSGDPVRDKSLAELKTLMAEQDRQIIANKLRSHHIGDTKKVKYEQPGFLKKPVTK
jgi:hypothetical protein